MAFLQRERARRGGAPVELYTFAQGVDTLFTDRTEWRYTSGDVQRKLGGAMFEPLAITRTAREASDEDQGRGLTLTLPLACPVAQLFLPRNPPHPVTVTVQRYHPGDGELATLFVGQVTEARHAGAAAVALTCEPPHHVLEGPFPRVAARRLCPFVLYDANCGMDPVNWRVGGAVTAVSADRRTLVVDAAAAAADGTYTGGILWHQDSGGVIGGGLGFRKTKILRHVGAGAPPEVTDPPGTIVLLTPDADLAVGHGVELLPACDRTTGPRGCAKFNNLARFGGFPYMPLKNPFTDGVL